MSHEYQLSWWPQDAEGEEYEVELICEFDYEPGCGETDVDPGERETMTLTSAVDLDGVDQLQYITPADVAALEQEALDKAHEWK